MAISLRLSARPCGALAEKIGTPDAEPETLECPCCGYEMGEQIKLMLDGDVCPYCEKGKMSMANPPCDQCGLVIDPRLVAWGRAEAGVGEEEGGAGTHHDGRGGVRHLAPAGPGLGLGELRRAFRRGRGEAEVEALQARGGEGELGHQQQHLAAGLQARAPTHAPGADARSASITLADSR